MHGKIPVIHSRFYNLISKMSGSVASALSILYEIFPWMQTWFYTSAQNLLDQKKNAQGYVPPFQKQVRTTSEIITRVTNKQSNLPPVLSGHSSHGLPQPFPTVLQHISNVTAPFIDSSQRLLVILVQQCAVLLSEKQDIEISKELYRETGVILLVVNARESHTRITFRFNCCDIEYCCCREHCCRTHKVTFTNPA